MVRIVIMEEQAEPRKQTVKIVVITGIVIVTTGIVITVITGKTVITVLSAITVITVTVSILALSGYIGVI